MPELALVSAIATARYDLQPQAIEALAQHSVDWRGIYRLQDSNGGWWVFRLFRRPDGDDMLTRAALLLEWLAQQHYPAPRVRRTTTHQLVGTLDGWTALVLSFVEGAVLDPAPADLALLGQAIGRLHALTVATPPAIIPSRCHPERIGTRTQQQLVLGSRSAPITFRPLVAALCASIIPIHHTPRSSIRITHGDCWYRNAIKTMAGTVILIDWDAAGTGLPLLDLGYVLLSAHLDLAQPFHIEPDAHKIDAIISGYHQHHRIQHQSQDMLLSALRFPLAFHLGNYLEQQTNIGSGDSFLLKVQQRFQATEQIAHLAASHFR